MKDIPAPNPGNSNKWSLIILRVVLGLIFISHGLARIYYESIPDFGAFLNSEGLYFGWLIAWTITIGEIIGGILLIIGLYIRYVVVFHFVIILTGIFLVHLPNGWFVVGHGNGGIEYSILILTVLIYLFTQYVPPLNQRN